jgi:hypothetical protein
VESCLEISNDWGYCNNCKWSFVLRWLEDPSYTDGVLDISEIMDFDYRWVGGVRIGKVSKPINRGGFNGGRTTVQEKDRQA